MGEIIIKFYTVKSFCKDTFDRDLTEIFQDDGPNRKCEIIYIGTDRKSKDIYHIATVKVTFKK